MSYDFLGQELHIGSRVAGLIHMQSSSDLYKGTVIKITPYTAVVKLDRGSERRFNFDKLINITGLENKNEGDYGEISAALQEFEDNAYHPSLKPDISEKAKVFAMVALNEQLKCTRIK